MVMLVVAIVVVFVVVVICVLPLLMPTPTGGGVALGNTPKKQRWCASLDSGAPMQPSKHLVKIDRLVLGPLCSSSLAQEESSHNHRKDYENNDDGESSHAQVVPIAQRIVQSICVVCTWRLCW